MNKLKRLQAFIQESENLIENLSEAYQAKGERFSTEDTVIVLMFRKVVESMDAVFILADNDHYKSAESIVRDLFEQSLYFFYLKDENSERKALSYIYSHNIHQIEIGKKTISDNAKAEKVRGFLNLSNNDSRTDTIRKLLKSREAVLEGEKYRNIKIEWSNMKRKAYKGKGPHPTWYNLFNGVKNIKELSYKYSWEVHYHLVYSIFSQQVHGKNALYQIDLFQKEAFFSPIRDDKQDYLIVHAAEVYGWRCIQEFVEYFDLHSTDHEEWRKNINV